MFSNVERMEELNMPSWVATCLETVTGRGMSVSVRSDVLSHDLAADLLLDLTFEARTQTYLAQAKSRPSTATLHGLSALAASGDEHVLLLAPHIPRGLAQKCRNLGIEFADAAGNVYLNWPNTLMIDVEGRAVAQVRSAAPDVTRRPVRSFRGQGLTVGFILLSFPDAATWSYRRISTAAGASLGTVQGVMTEFARLGFLGPETAAGHRRLHRTKDLFEHWLDGYLLDLEPKLGVGFYSVDDVRSCLGESLPAPESAWSGEAAAALLDPHLVPSTLTVYAPNRPTGLLARWKARRADPASANVHLRRKFWTGESSPTPLVPATLIYADLIASGDPRQHEAAARLRAGHELLQHLDQG